MNFDIKKFRPSFFTEAVIATEDRPRLCRKCPTKLPSWIKYYCSYSCKEAAQNDGSYGKEE
jgi:hypothetical protein